MINVCVTANNAASCAPSVSIILRKCVAMVLLVGSLVALGGYAYLRSSIQVSVVHAFFPTMEVSTAVR